MAAGDPLKVLYGEMAGLTEKECASGCNREAQGPYRCCERKFCEVARAYARVHYEIDLQETGNEELPFMGEAGCVVEPHLRPLCALHVCAIASGGELEEAKSKEYYRLRNAILDEGRRQGRLPPRAF